MVFSQGLSEGHKVKFHVDIVPPLLGKSALTDAFDEGFYLEADDLTVKMHCTGFGLYENLVTVQHIIEGMGGVFDGDYPAIERPQKPSLTVVEKKGDVDEMPVLWT